LYYSFAPPGPTGPTVQGIDCAETGVLNQQRAAAAAGSTLASSETEDPEWSGSTAGLTAARGSDGLSRILHKNGPCVISLPDHWLDVEGNAVQDSRHDGVGPSLEGSP